MNKKFSLMAFLLVPLMSSSCVVAQDLPSNMATEKIIQENAYQEANASWRIIKMIEDAKQKGLSGNQLVAYVLQMAEVEGYQKDQILSVIFKTYKQADYKKTRLRKMLRYTFYVVGGATILYIAYKIWNNQRKEKPEENQKKSREKSKRILNLFLKPVDRNFSLEKKQEFNTIIKEQKIQRLDDVFKLVSTILEKFPNDKFYKEITNDDYNIAALTVAWKNGRFLKK